MVSLAHVVEDHGLCLEIATEAERVAKNIISIMSQGKL